MCDGVDCLVAAARRSAGAREARRDIIVLLYQVVYVGELMTSF